MEINKIQFNISPSEGTTFVSMGGVDYIIGTLFILIGLLIYIVFQKKSIKNIKDFKKRQLDQYNKNKKTKVTDYNKTKLFLPFGERVKTSSPVMLFALFVIIGLSWIIWTAIGVPLTTL